MIAAVFHGNQDIRIEDVPEPDPGPGEVKLRVSYNGLCGSDVKEYFVGPHHYPVIPHPISGAKLPIVIGHEFSGEVVAIGDGIADVSIGDRVAVEPLNVCGHCELCRKGRFNLCDNAYFHGCHTLGGGLSEYTVVGRRNVHLLPDDVSLEQGALIEPMSVAMHAVQRGQVQPGEVAAVYGGGPIGIGLFLGLRAEGVERVIVVEPSVERRATLERLGCEEVLDPSAAGFNEHIVNITAGRGPDVSFDAAGVQGAFSAAVRTTAKAGRFYIVAGYESPVELQPNDMMMKEMTLTSSMAYCGEFTRVIDHMSHGRYPPTGWVEHAPIEALPEALKLLRSAKASKILIDLPGAPG